MFLDRLDREPYSSSVKSRKRTGTFFDEVAITAALAEEQPPTVIQQDEATTPPMDNTQRPNVEYTAQGRAAEVDEDTDGSDSDEHVELKPARTRRATGHDFESIPAAEPGKWRKFSKMLPVVLKPWKWRRRKPTPSLEPTVKALERKLSCRPSRQQVVASGIVHEDDIPVDVVELLVAVSAPPTTSLDDERAADPVAGTSHGGHSVQLKESLADSNRTQVASRLSRKLAHRTSKNELRDKNILLTVDETEEERIEHKKTIKACLKRRLSQRSSVQDLKTKGVLMFYEYVDVVDTWPVHVYDRSGDRPWTRLTIADKVYTRRGKKGHVWRKEMRREKMRNPVKSAAASPFLLPKQLTKHFSLVYHLSF